MTSDTGTPRPENSGLSVRPRISTTRLAMSRDRSTSSWLVTSCSLTSRALSSARSLREKAVSNLSTITRASAV